MLQPGLELRRLMLTLRERVSEIALVQAGHKQSPSYYDEMNGEFYFLPPATAPVGITECDRLVDPNASAAQLQRVDADAALKACGDLVSRYPGEREPGCSSASSRAGW